MGARPRLIARCVGCAGAKSARNRDSGSPPSPNLSQRLVKSVEHSTRILHRRRDASGPEEKEGARCRSKSCARKSCARSRRDGSSTARYSGHVSGSGRPSERFAVDVAAFASLGTNRADLILAVVTLARARAQADRASDGHGLGLINPCNICYANVAVQLFSLLICALVRSRVASEHHGPGCACVDCELRTTALELHHRRHDALRHPMGSLDARALIARVAPGFELGQHHDAAEFLLELFRRSVNNYVYMQQEDHSAPLL